MLSISVVIEEEEPDEAYGLRFAFGYLRIEAGKLRLELFRETNCLIVMTAEGLFQCLLEMSERKSARVLWSMSIADYYAGPDCWLIKEKGQLVLNVEGCRLQFPFNVFRDALQLAILNMPPRPLAST